MDSETDRADIKVTPPVIFSGYLAGGFLLTWMAPISVLPGTLARGLGICLLLAAGVIAGTAILAMKRGNTGIHPRQTTTALVTEGPFRHTRNPLYVSLVAIYLGLGLVINSLWMALLAVALAVTLQRVVIVAEERYLEDKFGDAYRDFTARVRRWL